MKTSNSLKFTGLMALALGLLIGCAGTTEKEPEPAQPAPEPVAAPEPAPEPTPAPAAPAMGQYEVSGGDNLWNISAKSDVYGNPYQWPLIYKANSDKIKDADLIFPGQVLDIDNNPTDADVNAAVNHAKTRGSWTLGVVEDSDKAYLAQ